MLFADTRCVCARRCLNWTFRRADYIIEITRMHTQHIPCAISICHSAAGTSLTQSRRGVHHLMPSNLLTPPAHPPPHPSHPPPPAHTPYGCTQPPTHTPAPAADPPSAQRSIPGPPSHPLSKAPPPPPLQQARPAAGAAAAGSRFSGRGRRQGMLGCRLWYLMGWLTPASPRIGGVRRGGACLWGAWGDWLGRLAGNG